MDSRVTAKVLSLMPLRTQFDYNSEQAAAEAVCIECRQYIVNGVSPTDIRGKKFLKYENKKISAMSSAYWRALA